MVTSNVYINDVVIEMTRRCNMTCDHCLRGPMQKKDQTKENIDKFFSHVDGIGSITFTGGEPSLVPDLIEYARQSAERNCVEIGNFFIVTNGKKITEDFAVVCLKWYAYCHDNEASSVEVSQDDFHDYETLLNYRLLKGLSFFRMRNYTDSVYVLEQGKGKDFATGRKVVKEHLEVSQEEDAGGFSISEGVIYLNCKGELIAGCDWSYRNQSRNKICDVGELSLGSLEEAGADIEYLEVQ